MLVVRTARSIYVVKFVWVMGGILFWPAFSGDCYLDV